VISIVIPLFNKEKAIINTIESVLEQTFVDYELIVVNDGSTDNSFKVINQYSMFCSARRIFVVDKANGGVCSARNRGILEARGEYIAFLDADDIWDNDYLSEQMRMIEDFPDASMWGINFAEISNGTLVRSLPTGLTPGYRGYVSNYFEMPGRVSDLFCSSSVVIRRNVFDTVGLFDERLRFAEDNDMWFRIISNFKVAFFDSYKVHYMFDAENRALTKPRELKYFLAYYPEKFKEVIYKRNQPFYRWIMCWCAQHIKRYYFGNDITQIEDAKFAAGKLDYSVIPRKYSVLFNLPYPVGKWMNRIDEKRMNRKKARQC